MMKVTLKIFLPELSEVIGAKELEVEFGGETVGDLIEHLATAYGRKARQALYNDSGEFYPIIQVLLNGEEWVTPDQLDRCLRDGDNILLMVMMAGG